jgi:hypothetical protein
MGAVAAPRLVLPNIMSDRMLDSLTEPPPRIHWAEVGDDEL